MRSLTFHYRWLTYFMVVVQSEDKKFKPVKEISGPLLALKHVVRQDYFPRESADILIAFLTKLV